MFNFKVMGAFNVKVNGLDFLEKRIKNSHKSIYNQYVKIIDDSVIEIYKLAKAKVPIGKTSNLEKSIGYSLYNPSSGASVFANIKYAPYVEFGTGESYGLPSYPNIKRSSLDNYAHTFKVRKKELIGRPYKPFMFNSYSEVYTKMLKNLRQIKI